MKRNVVFRTLTQLTLAASLAACGGGDDDGGDVTQPDVTTGEYNHFITDSLTLPATTQEVSSLAFDLDDDGKTDNQLGSVMRILVQQGGDVQGSVDKAITEGNIVILHSVRADKLDIDPSVSWQVYLGDTFAAGTPPKLDGTDTATVAADSPTDAQVRGPITGGKFTGGPNAVSVQISLVEGGDPIRLDLVGARIEAAQVTADGCTGAKLGGAVTKENLDSDVLPAIATMMTDQIEKDTDCMPEMNSCTQSAASFIQKTFDTDLDLMITLLELQNNTLIKTFLRPDVDLLNEAGDLEPDGTPESLSLGIGFSCTKATFTAAGEQ